MKLTRIDFALASALALEALPLWAPALLGPRATVYAPGEVRWWPNRFDGVHVFTGEEVVSLGDWSGRWLTGQTWGLDAIALIARRRRCRPGQAVAWLCRAAAVPFEALTIDRRRAA